MSQLTLIIPELAQLDATQSVALTDFENLATLFSKSKQSEHQSNYFDTLFMAMGLQSNCQPSIAALSARADGLKCDAHYCLRMDPVELRADLAAVYMYGNHHFDITEVQCQQVAALIQPLLAEYAMTLHTTAKKRWYVSFDTKPDVSSVDPNHIIGKDILNYLPEGSEPINWKRLQTEIQMTLFNKPDIAPINSLWIWGSGERLSEKPKVSPKVMYADEVTAQGTAHYLAYELHSLSEFNSACDFKTDIIIIHDRFQNICDYADYQLQLLEFEKRIIQPALQALRLKKINTLILYPINGNKYELTRRDLLCFWKSKKTVIEQLCKRTS